jgi:hypothetical protein
MTSEHDSASIAATSLLATGEVCATAKAAAQSLCVITDTQRMPIGVVGDSMFGKECTREDGRPGGIDRWQQCPSGVRAAIVAKKRGNARGAKGGRKAEVRRP